MGGQNDKQLVADRTATEIKSHLQFQLARSINYSLMQQFLHSLLFRPWPVPVHTGYRSSRELSYFELYFPSFKVYNWNLLFIRIYMSESLYKAFVYFVCMYVCPYIVWCIPAAVNGPVCLDIVSLLYLRLFCWLNLETCVLGKNGWEYVKNFFNTQ